MDRDTALADLMHLKRDHDKLVEGLEAEIAYYEDLLKRFPGDPFDSGDRAQGVAAARRGARFRLQQLLDTYKGEQ